MKLATLNRLLSLREDNDATRVLMDALAPRFAALATRHEDGTAPQAVSAHQLFQTPVALASELVALLDIQPGQRVLEPSAGLGRLIDPILSHSPSEVLAVEMAAPCARELFNRGHSLVKLLQRDFLTVSPSETGLFDAIAMNPPFTMRSDVRHIRHALTFLRPGGTLAALCLDSHHRRTAFQHLANTWKEIPAGAFKSEGTSVPTIMFSITL